MISVVGIGPGALEYLAPAAVEKIKKADIVLGSRRALESVMAHARSTRELSRDYESEVRFILENKEKDVAVVVSGDPGLYSFLAVLKKHLPADLIEVVPGISSVQLFMAKLGRTWEDVRLVSLHGRSEMELLKALETHSRICLMLDANNSASKIGNILNQNGYRGRAWVGMNLSYADERIVESSLTDAIELDANASALMYIEIEQVGPDSSFYGVGIGPGDPELITIKARRLIERADIIFAPKADAEGESFALSIVANFAKGARVERVVFPMTSDEAILKENWAKAADEICERLDQGLNIVFITIGDPMLYSTFIYLMREVTERRPRAELGIVPGISAVSALASTAALPLAESKDRIALIPMPDNPSDLIPYLQNFETVVLMKVGKRLPKLIEFLEGKMASGTTVLGSRVGTPDERIIFDLAEIKSNPHVGYLSTVIIRTGVSSRTGALGLRR